MCLLKEKDVILPSQEGTNVTSFAPGEKSIWLKPPLAQHASRLKILLDVFLAFVSCPTRWRPLPERILHIRSGAAFHQQADDLIVTPCGSLMQRRRMGVEANRVVAIGVTACIQQQLDDLRVAMLGCQGQGAMALFTG
jgi:hypothetical protein